MKVEGPVSQSGLRGSQAAGVPLDGAHTWYLASESVADDALFFIESVLNYSAQRDLLLAKTRV